MIIKDDLKNIKIRFRKYYEEEFNDPNESFLDFLFELVSEEKLLMVMSREKNYLAAVQTLPSYE